MKYHIIYHNDSPVYVFVGDYQKAKIKMDEKCFSHFQWLRRFIGVTSKDYEEVHFWYIKSVEGEKS